MEAIKELERENFEVFRLAKLSPTESYILRPKTKTDEELIELFGRKEGYKERSLFSQYKEAYLVTRTFKEAVSGVTVEELVSKRKLELL